MEVECNTYTLCFYYRKQAIAVRVHVSSKPSKREIRIIVEPLFS